MVGRAVGVAVVRIFLNPHARTAVAVVDIVTECLLLTPAEVRPLNDEARFRPVAVEIQSFRHAHREHDVASPPALCRASTNYPIVELSDTADIRLAGGQRAVTAEWIRGESEVPSYNVRK